MATPIIKAVDVGYGNTKYSVLASDKNIQCGIFPSISPQASNGPDLSSGLLQRRNTIVVKVGGVKYEVGKDVCCPAWRRPYRSPQNTRQNW